jgi:5-formyltetrahydrofolate cyclo-ligase
VDEADRTRKLRASKSDLRARMQRLRASVPEDARARLGGLIEERLAGLPAFAAATSTLLFYSFGSEVPTAGLIQRAVAAGKRVLLPYLDGDSLEAAEVSPDQALVPTGYGPKEPGRRIPVDPAEVDLVVTPGLAFDRHGHRLGYGRGFYDRYLGRLRRDALRTGVAFGFQVVDAVPAGPRDEVVDLIVTEGEVIECRSTRGNRGPPL